MYNTHRGMIPQPNNRLNELLEQLRQEFDNQSRTAGDYEHQGMRPRHQGSPGTEPSLPFAPIVLTNSQVAGQVQEMEQIRAKIYQLEQAQIKIKQE